MKSYHRGATPKLRTYWYTYGTTTKISPASGVKCQILKPDGTTAQAYATMVEDGTGDYSYSDYALPSDADLGIWEVWFKATESAKDTIIKGSFRVMV